MPNFSLLRRYEATFALRMTFLLGKQAMFGRDPPNVFAFNDCNALPALSKGPGSDCSSRAAAHLWLRLTRADEALFRRFVRIVLSEGPLHSWLALIS